jgi:serine/threonine-protein kinase
MLSLAKKVGRRSDPRFSIEPARVGPYRLCLELASGGMATVYLGHSEATGNGRFAAVKVLHPHLANDAAFAAMFVDEAEIASRISHVNVCTVYDYDVAPGSSFIAMEYLLGHPLSTLHRKLAKRSAAHVKRDAQLIARALADACEGLHAAHELCDDDGDPLEVVHRDVSPGNIIITFDGVTKVVDFGVAAAARKRHRTETGMLKGKIAYIAPECLRGMKADRRSDVWGVGVIAWELVTGQRLFRSGSDVDTLRAVMEAKVLPPSEVRPELPKELDAIVMRALERDPDGRYSTAREFGRELARFANHDEVITTADLSEWLDELFPGAKERKHQVLDLAAQIASGERKQPLSVGSGVSIAPLTPTGATRTELDSTRVYDRELPRSDVWTVRRMASPWVALLALVIGVGVGGFTFKALSEDDPPTATIAPIAPGSAAIPQPGATSARSELRIRPGGGIARGPYVLELVESAPDELLLRIRLDPPLSDAAQAPMTEPPSPEPATSN